MRKGSKVSDMRSEYDFSKGVRGKYAKKYHQSSNVVILERCRGSSQTGGQSGFAVINECKIQAPNKRFCRRAHSLRVPIVRAGL